MEFRRARRRGGGIEEGSQFDASNSGCFDSDLQQKVMSMKSENRRDSKFVIKRREANGTAARRNGKEAVAKEVVGMRIMMSRELLKCDEGGGVTLEGSGSGWIREITGARASDQIMHHSGRS